MAESQFLSVYEFVDQIITPMYATSATRANRANWAKRWWAHPEAVARLDALWRRYEQLRMDEPGTFFESFLRGHADYHMRYLMKDDGVFADCRNEDTPSVPLASEPIPTID